MLESNYMLKINADKKIVLALAFVLSGVLVVVLAGYLCRGAIRDHVMPWYTMQFLVSGLQHNFDRELYNLDDPFRQFGLRVQDDVKSCALDAAKGLSTSTFCNFSRSNSKDSLLSTEVLRNFSTYAQKLDNKLSQNGWYNNLPKDSKEKLANMNPDTDWADITLGTGARYTKLVPYSKKVGAGGCQIIFQINKKDNFQIIYSCDQPFYFFGNPYKY